MAFTIATLGTQIAPEGVAILEDAGARLVWTDAYPSNDEVVRVIGDNNPDALIIRLIDGLTDAHLALAPALRLIAKHGVGTNDIDVAAARARNIPVLMATGANAHSVAEHALGLIFALVKDFAAQDRHVRAGRWDKKLYNGRELRGQRLGLVGFGLIGQTLARMLEPVGVIVSAYDPYAPDSAFLPGVERAADLDRLLATSDIVSLHTPLTEATRGLLDARRIALMQPGAILINTARGEVVDDRPSSRPCATAISPPPASTVFPKSRRSPARSGTCPTSSSRRTSPASPRIPSAPSRPSPPRMSCGS